MTLRTKLLSATIATALTTMFLALTLGIGSAKIGDRIAELQTMSTALRNHMNADMMHDALRADVYSALYESIRNPDKKADIEKNVAEHAGDLQRSIQDNKNLELPPEVEKELSSIQDPLAAYVAAAMKLVPLAFTDRTAAEALLPNFAVRFSDLEKSMETVGDEIAAANRRASENSESFTANAKYLSAAGIVIGLVVSALAMVIAVVGILRPLGVITNTMTRLSEGQSDVSIPEARNDEIGKMIEALRVFRDAGLENVRLQQEAAAQEKARLERELAERAAAAEAEEKARAAELANEEARRIAEQEAIEKERAIVSNSIGTALTMLAQKNLTYRITQDIPEAYVKLKDDFNTAISELAKVMSGVSEHTVSIASGTKEIAQAADELARRTETQAAALEQSAAALASITETVQSAAKGAAHARQVVEVAKDDATKSSTVVQNTVTAMDNIEKSSRQISQIIGVIDEIAFQTNLLALNAGVEAARAGDAGRGFAVVASEVRALAQRAAEAAKEIKSLILSSGTQVAHGVALVAETGQSLDRILSQIAEINSEMQKIDEGAREQASSIEQVNQAIAEMDQGTQRNASMAEETNAAGQTLAGEAETLSGLVHLFNIDGGTASGSDHASTQVSALRNLHRAATKPAKPAAVPAAKVANADWEEF